MQNIKTKNQKILHASGWHKYANKLLPTFTYPNLNLYQSFLNK